MILHYANLCAIAGGVNLFLIGSELRGLETIRGPAWTQGGNARRLGRRGLGLSVRRRPRRARRPTCARSSTAQGSDEEAADALKPHRLFGRLVGLDGLSARRAQNGQWPHLDPLVGARRTSTSSASTITCRCPTGRPATAASTRRTGSRPRLHGAWPPSAASDERPRAFRRADDLFARLSQGQHRGRRKIQLVVRRRRQRRARASTPTAPTSSSRCPQGDRLAQARSPYCAEPAVARQQAVALVVEQPASGGLRRRRRRGLGAARAADRMGRRSRSRSPSSNTASPPATRRPTSRTSSSTRSRASSATPYWSIWEPDRRRRLRAAARRHDRRARAAGGL